jgi:hypothetical protein
MQRRGDHAVKQGAQSVIIQGQQLRGIHLCPIEQMKTAESRGVSTFQLATGSLSEPASE